LTTCFFARLDGSCSPIRLRRSNCSAHCYGRASRQSPRRAVVGTISADTGGCGASVGGGRPIWASGAEYHHARGPEEPPNSQLSRGRSTCQWWARRLGARDGQILEVCWYVWPLCPGLPHCSGLSQALAGLPRIAVRPLTCFPCRRRRKSLTH
jgi:hypothetical protein